jgi:hypothetical protein
MSLLIAYKRPNDKIHSLVRLSDDQYVMIATAEKAIFDKILSLP